MTLEKFQRRLLALAVLVVLSASATFAQGTGFSFQGRLNDGANPANGQYDLQFRLYTLIVGGSQIGSTIARPATVLTNGVFSVTLDFGPAAFNNPNAVFLEIAVKPSGSPNALTVLGPRQQLTVVPFAVRANNATNADFATNAANSTNAVNASTAASATNALSLGSVGPAGWTRLNVQNTGGLLITDGVQMGGNATQSLNSNGLVKAMVVIDDTTTDPRILRCYNGITNSSSGNCGFSVIRAPGLSGVYKIDFGFTITSRFFAVAAEYRNGEFNPATNNNGINYRVFNSSTLDVFTFTNSWSDTADIYSFSVIVL